MSHFTTVETKIRDLVRLREALDDLDLAYSAAEAGQTLTVKGYAGRKESAGMVIHVSRTYDVGVQVDESGAVRFVADWWGVETSKGWTEQEFLDRVTRRYAYRKVTHELRERGYRYEETEEGETVHIKVTTWR